VTREEVLVNAGYTTHENLQVTSQSTEVPNRYFQGKQFRKLTTFVFISFSQKTVLHTTAKVKN
jgi:hypothetical protein